MRQNDYLEIHVGVLEGIACKRHGKCWKNENNLIKMGGKKMYCVVDKRNEG